jgi:hypothetical protein
MYHTAPCEFLEEPAAGSPIAKAPIFALSHVCRLPNSDSSLYQAVQPMASIAPNVIEKQYKDHTSDS